jgi:hypothetical protein
MRWSTPSQVSRQSSLGNNALSCSYSRSAPAFTLTVAETVQEKLLGFELKKGSQRSHTTCWYLRHHAHGILSVSCVTEPESTIQDPVSCVDQGSKRSVLNDCNAC